MLALAAPQLLLVYGPGLTISAQDRGGRRLEGRMFHMGESTTFGRQLRQLALSIDLIDRSHFAEIQQMVIGYVTERLGAPSRSPCSQESL